MPATLWPDIEVLSRQASKSGGFSHSQVFVTTLAQRLRQIYGPLPKVVMPLDGSCRNHRSAFWSLGISVLYMLPIVVFSAAMIFAGLRDLTTMTIPNWLTLALAFSFFVFAPLVSMPLAEVGLHAAVGFAVLLVGIGFFGMGWIGGGDAKLLAAVALWVGWGQALSYLVIASVLGGALTLLILGFRTLPLPALLVRQQWLARLHDRSEGIPYGLALAVAALLIFPETDVFRLVVALG